MQQWYEQASYALMSYTTWGFMASPSPLKPSPKAKVVHELADGIVSGEKKMYILVQFFLTCKQVFILHELSWAVNIRWGAPSTHAATIKNT